MKKILISLLMALGLNASMVELDGIAGYEFKCDTDTNKVMVESSDEVLYKVVWVNPETTVNEWLSCTDYETYINIYTEESDVQR